MLLPLSRPVVAEKEPTIMYSTNKIIKTISLIGAFACFALSLHARAVRQNAYDASNANTFLGNYALLNNTSGYQDTATDSGAQIAKRFLLGRAEFAAGSGPLGLATGDFNRDGIIDLAVANVGSNSASVLLGKGHGAFGAARSFAAGPGSRAIVAADFNGDGILDLAVANAGTVPVGTISILIGNGDGTFQDHVDYATGAGPSWVATGDFNSDGKLDLAVSEGNLGAGTTVGVLLGNGDGTFEPVVHYTAGANPTYVLTADFNGDNNLDLAVVNCVGTVSILLGNGDGSFGPHQDFTVGSCPTGGVAADFNQDGKIDLAVPNWGDGSGDSVSVLLGNGDGTFTTQVQYETGIGPASVIAADMNLDGCIDLVVTNNGPHGTNTPGTGATVSILLGKCDGTFSGRRDFSTGIGPAGLAAGHFAPGPKPDLAVANNGLDQQSVSILLGNSF
jgi:hypothetical protein